LFCRLVPDWALHCIDNPDVTVQYISDSGAVQLSRRCQDSTKEISCQQRMSSMEMYNELRCPEELSTTVTVSTTVEVLSSTTEESHPEVIIKNPQKMLEDVFDVQIEVDSNRLDVVDAKKDLDLMLGDQPVADTSEDKKTLLKIADKKEIAGKKSKNLKKESKIKESAAIVDDTEMMMGDAPAAEEAFQSTTEVPSKVESSTTDRQRRDAAETTLAFSTDSPSSTLSDVTEDSSATSTDLTTETPLVTTVLPEETTTKFIVHGHPLFHSANIQKEPAEVDRKDVQGHPLFHSQTIFKDPISVDPTNDTFERKNVTNDDHFIPPMLLVKARFSSKSTEGTEEAKETTTDGANSAVTVDGINSTETSESDDKNVTAKPTESNEISTNEISSVTQLETTLTSSGDQEKPIKIEKRNDPRLGLSPTTTSAPAVPSTIAQETTSEPPSSSAEESTTVAVESTSYESSVSEISTTESQTEISEASETSSDETSPAKSPEASTSVQPESTAERLIESTTHKIESSSVTPFSVTPIAIKLTTLRIPEVSSQKPITKSSTPMRNDIHLHNDDSHEDSEEAESEEHHHLESSLNNEENYQAYKPNRHRSHLDHRRGPGFSIGKILGK
jgi:hypothetical protein